MERSLDDNAVAATVTDEGDKGGGADGLESDAAGYIYATNYEHNAILRRRFGGEWETVVHDPRLLWPDTCTSQRTSCTVRRNTYKVEICAKNPTRSSVLALMLNLFCCDDHR